MSYSVTIPDFAGALARGEQMQASRLQRLAMERDLQQGAAVDAALGNGGAAALFGGDAAARDSVLSRLAGAGRQGLSVAMPIFQTQQQRLTPMTPEQAQALGLRPGTVAMVDGLGRPQILQAPDTMSGEAEAQRVRIANASRPPQAPLIVPPGASVVGRNGQPMFTAPMRPQSPFEASEGGAPQIITDLAPLIANGTATPQQQRTYALAVGQWQTQGAQAFERVGPTGAIERVLVPRQLPEGFPPPLPFNQPAASPQQAGAAQDAPRVAAAPADPNAPRVMSATQPGNAPMTEAQSRDNFFGAQMRMGDETLRGVRVPSAVALLAWRNAPEAVVNMGLSPNDQQYFNAVRLFAAGVLRKETGAAFTANELLDVQSRFFPMPGDSPQVIAQKARAREQAIGSLVAAIPGGLRGATGPSIPGPGGVGTAEPPPRIPPPPAGFEIIR